MELKFDITGTQRKEMVSITYSEIDDTTGKIIRDNYRIDRVLVDKTAVAACDSIADVAQAFIDSIE